MKLTADQPTTRRSSQSRSDLSAVGRNWLTRKPTGQPTFFSHLTMALLASVLTLVGLTACTQTTQVTSQTVTSSNPNRTKQDPQEIARVRTAIAAEFIRAHKLDDAQRQLEQALTADPKSAAANDMMGILLQQEGSSINLKKAEGYFKKSIALDPEFSQARNNYGVYLAQMQRYNEAIAQFQIAGAALGYEGRADALENLGRTALKVNNRKLATESFIKALDANRQSIIARAELVDILLADGRPIDARQLYNDLVVLIGEDNLDPRTLLQGIRLARLNNNPAQQQSLTQRLFDRYPLSNEARQLKTWLSNPAATWK